MKRYFALIILGLCLACAGIASAEPTPPDAGTVAVDVDKPDATPVAAPAAVAGVNPDELQSQGEVIREASTLWQSASEKRWLPVLGSFLMLLIYVLRRFILGGVGWFKTRIGAAVLAFSLSMVLTCAIGLKAGATMDVSLLAESLATALAAAGIWSSRPTKLARAPD